MDIKALFSDKSIKGKALTEIVCQYLLNQSVSTDELVQFAAQSKDAVKATCIEALEFATKQQPEIINYSCFQFVTECLNAKAPRVKWESARVIANTAGLFKEKLDEPIKSLLDNTTHPGTVVRWSAAVALAEIIKLKTNYNVELIPAVESICNTEIKNSIKKIYSAALKVIKKT